MGFITGKIFTVLAAGTIVVGASAYTGSTLVSNIQGNIEAVKEQAQLFHDEAYSKGKIAEEFVNQKNMEINRLGNEIDRLNTELTTANGEIAEGNSEIAEANAAIAQANADMSGLDTYSAAAVETVSNMTSLGGIVDGQSVVKGNTLDIAPVQSQTIVKKIKLVNKNGINIVVNHNGESVTVPAGDVIYVVNKPAAVDTFTYVLDNADGSTRTVVKEIRTN